MNKEEQDLKNDIGKRLKLSNKNLWDSLSKDEQESIINRYYDSSSISDIGISGVLGNIRDTSRDLILIIMGLLLGFLGGMVNDILEKYLPNGYVYDILFVAFFTVLIYLFYREIINLNVAQLRSYNVLDYFVDIEKKEQEKNKIEKEQNKNI